MTFSLTLLAIGATLLAAAGLVAALQDQRWWHCPRCHTYYSASGKKASIKPHCHEIKNKVCHECT